MANCVSGSCLTPAQGAPGPKGIRGQTGAQGPIGPQGPAGEGVPPQGEAGQVLAKASNVDFDTEWITSPASSAEWGFITGTLSNQTDLQNALNAKQNLITLGNNLQYFRGDLSLATFPTDLSDFINDEGFITGVSWGQLTGTLSNQTDLQSALNAKQNVITTGTTAQYFRGNLSLATFPTDLSSFSNGPGYITSAEAPVQNVYNSDGTIYIPSDTGSVEVSVNQAAAFNWTNAHTWGGVITIDASSSIQFNVNSNMWVDDGGIVWTNSIASTLGAGIINLDAGETRLADDNGLVLDGGLITFRNIGTDVATLDSSALTLNEVSLVVNYSGGSNALLVQGTNFTRFAVDNTTAATGGGVYGIASMSILSESGKRYFQSACYCSSGNGSRYGLSLNGMAEHVAVENTGGGLTSFVIGTYNSSAPVVFVSNQVERFRIPSTGGLTFVDANNIAFGTTTGTKIGAATSQKLAFWNATPIIQPTTGVAAATFVAGAGTAVNDASTFDGYTIKKVVKALRNIGLLA